MRKPGDPRVPTAAAAAGPRRPLSPPPKLWVRARGRGEGRGGRRGGPGRGARRQCPRARLGAGLGGVGRPVPGCVCRQHLSAPGLRRPPEGRGAGARAEPPEENNNSPRAGGGSWPPGEPQTSSRRKYVEPSLARLPGRWGLGSRAAEEGSAEQPSVGSRNASCAARRGPPAAARWLVHLESWDSGVSAPRIGALSPPPQANARRVEKVLF